jgi:hypothetical protein
MILRRARSSGAQLCLTHIETSFGAAWGTSEGVGRDPKPRRPIAFVRRIYLCNSRKGGHPTPETLRVRPP